MDCLFDNRVSSDFWSIVGWERCRESVEERHIKHTEDIKEFEQPQQPPSF